MISVTKTFLPSLDDYINRLNTIWENSWVTNNGALLKELESELSKYLEIPAIQLVANGTLALQLSLKAFDLQGEVITTPYTYVATATAIKWEGCKPIFVDIERNNFCIDPELIEQIITKNTSAIIVTHVYGYPSNVTKLQNIATKYGLKLIYDAAHCFGVKLDGKSILTYGDASIISFHATKIFHTVEGGGVVSNDKGFLQRVRLMKQFGHLGEDNYIDIGINAKMSELHAAMGLCILPAIDKIISFRRNIYELYEELLSSSSIIRPTIPDNLEYNYAYYPILLSSHDDMLRVRESLFNQGIGTRRYFSPSLNTLPYLESIDECPVSEDISSRILCLPMHHDLDEIEINNIVNIVLAETKL